MENKKILPNKEKIIELYNGIICFVESFSNKVKNTKDEIKSTSFLENLKNIYSNITSDKVEGNDLIEAINFLKKYNFDMDKEGKLLLFYKKFLNKEDSLNKIEEKIKLYLEYGFTDFNHGSELTTQDIDNLRIFNKLLKDNILNKDIKTDENLFCTINSVLKNNDIFYQKYISFLDIYNHIDFFDEKNYIFELINKFKSFLSIKIYFDNSKKLYDYNCENKYDYTSKDIEHLMKGYNEKKIERDETDEEFELIIENIKNFIEIINHLLKSGYIS